MNLPLNIDIQQILLHLFNFALLFAGLYFLMYKPVKKFMDKRTAYYKDMEDEAKGKLESVNNLESQYNNYLDNAKEQAEKIKSDAASEAVKAYDLQMDAAKKESDKIIAHAKRKATAQSEEIIAEAQHEITALAIEATAKLLAESSVLNQLSKAPEGSEN